MKRAKGGAPAKPPAPGGGQKPVPRADAKAGRAPGAPPGKK